MKFLFEYSKKKLIILTILEVVFLLVGILMSVITFKYTFELALNDFTGPWIGNTLQDITTRYNVPLMNTLSMIGNISLLLWFFANGIRFAIIKPKYKIIFGIGAAMLFAGLWCFFSINIPIVIAWILMGLSLVPIIYSHKIDKEEIKQ